MEKFEAPSVLISCHGVRYGLIYKKIENPKLKNPGPNTFCPLDEVVIE
jgi:hypothetical protein